MSNPQEIEAEVKREWYVIHGGEGWTTVAMSLAKAKRALANLRNDHPRYPYTVCRLVPVKAKKVKAKKGASDAS